MPGGKLEVALAPLDAPSSGGAESVELMVTANPGQPLASLARVASGGELSRISLAIQVLLSADASVPTLIFDEIDAGIGGAVAEVVGQLLQTLSRHHQVLSVTHLPQVAVHAFLDALTLFGIGASWGGFESLAIPFDCTAMRSATSWAPGGPGVRFHIGLEDVDDLIADLERGFAALAAAR